MKNDTHVMLDIETLGTKPGAVIFQIGAVAFNPFKIETLDKNNDHPSKFLDVRIDVENSLKHGHKIEYGTLRWWLEDGKGPLFYELLADETRMPVSVALATLSNFYTSNNARHVWAQGASFDMPLVEAYYTEQGEEAPWKFWQTLDSRTMFNVEGKRVKRSGVAHNALDDAIDQARSLQQLFAGRAA